MNNKNIIAKGIQNGANTHHHDQLIRFVNFRIKNIRNNIVPNPNPLVSLFDIF
jgi:hypothetical protein